MKQIELTSKLMLAIIGLTSVGAILVPTYAVPTIKSADIFDGEVKTADLANNAVTSPKIQNGQVSTDDLANNAVTTGKIADDAIQAEDIADGVIPSGGTQPTVHVVTKLVNLTPHLLTTTTISCPDGEIATGGGFRAPLEFVTYESHPTSSAAQPAEAWVVGVWNPTDDIDNDFEAFVKCMDFTP